MGTSRCSEFEAALGALLSSDEAAEFFSVDQPLDVVSFAEAGVLTRNSGLVVRLADGAELQVTIVQSRRPTPWHGDLSPNGEEA